MPTLEELLMNPFRAAESNPGDIPNYGSSQGGVFVDPSRALPAISPMQAESQNLSAATGVGGGGGGRQALRPMPQGQSIQDVINKVQESASMQARAKQEEQKEPMEVVATSKRGGKPTYEFKNVDHDDMQQMFEALQFTRQAMQGYQQEFQRLGQQEKNLTTGFGPIGNALSTLAGNMATNDPRLPPIVRALGQTAKDLNPTVDQIRARKLAVGGEMADIAQRQEAIIGQEEGRREAAFQRQEAQDLRLRTQEERERAKGVEEERLAEKQDVDQTRKLYTSMALATKGGKYIGDEAVENAAKSFGIKKQDVIDQAKLFLRRDAEAVERGKEAEQTRDKEMVDYRAAAQRQNLINSYALKTAYNFGPDKREFMTFQTKLKEQSRIDMNLGMLRPKQLDELGAIVETDKFLDEVEDKFKKFSNLSGFRSRLMRDVPTYLKGADRVEFENLLRHETPRIIGGVLGIKGGASILRTDAGREMIRQLGVSPDMTVEQASRALANIRMVLRNHREGIVRTVPTADLRAYGPLFGHDSDIVNRDPYGTPPGLAGPGGVAPGVTTPPGISFSDFQSGTWRQ